MPRLFETFHTLFIWIYLYWLTITNYGQPASLVATNWSFLASVPLTFLVALMIHVISTLPQPMRRPRTEIISVAVLCLPGARGLRPCLHSFNFGDRSDLALHLRDFRSCTGFYYSPSPRILFQMEMALDHTRNTLHVHRSLEHVILVLLSLTPTDRCQTVSSHLVDVIYNHNVKNVTLQNPARRGQDHGVCRWYSYPIFTIVSLP